MLKHLPRKQLLVPLDLQRPKYLQAFTEMTKAMIPIVEAGLSNMTCPALPDPSELSVDHILTGDDGGTQPVADTVDHLFPCILAVIGSSVDYIKVSRLKHASEIETCINMW